jgi:pimeloyl-ACP methyl ester carboxylesterase
MIERTQARVSAPFELLVPHGSRDRPPLVVVHGVSTPGSAYFDAFRTLAIRHRRVLLAPRFERPRFRGYQKLSGVEGPLSAADALEAMFEEAAERSGAQFGRVDVVGFSGGAQFSHRYAMLRPDRVRRAVVAAAGWYTILDPSRPFPQGTGPSEASGGEPVEVDRFLGIPLRVMVGENDVRRDAYLRSDDVIDEKQGVHRLSRALRWVEHVRTEASRRGMEPQASFELLPRSGHSFRQAMVRADFGERALAFLEDGPAD